MHLSVVAMMDNSDRYLRKLYEMSEGHMTTFDRHEIGRKLGLDDDETDEIVDELEESGKIKTPLGNTVVLSRAAKDMLDSEKGIA